LRLHPNKINAKVILPGSSNEDCNGISRFLNILSKNDSRIRKSYMDKKLGGYISINKEDDEDDDNIQESISYKYDMIYNSIGVLTNNIEIWCNRLDELKKYMDEHKKRPSSESKNKDEKKLGQWLLNQTQKSQKRKDIMKTNEIYNKWNEFINDDKYREYFISKNWYNRFDELKKYMDENNKRPSYSSSKNKDERKLGQWLQKQIIYSQNRRSSYIMKNDDIYNKWNQFINDDKYSRYFMSNEEKWKNILEKVKKYMDENNKRPSSSSKNKDEKELGKWVKNQIIYSDSEERKNIMKDNKIYYKWLIYCYNKKSCFRFRYDFIYFNIIEEKIPEILKSLCKERKIDYNENDDNTILKNKLINYASRDNPLNDDELKFINSI
jgi:hypothetical protein